MNWIKSSVLILICLVEICVAGTKVYPVVEEQPAGTFVADAREEISSNFSEKIDLKFGFLRGYDKKGFFQINENSGKITTATKLDRETLCAGREGSECFFEIPVITFPLHKFRIIPIKIQLLDINDNAPFFPQKEILLEISENHKIGDKFLIPTATDADQTETSATKIDYFLKIFSKNLEKNLKKNNFSETEIPFILVKSVDEEKENLFLQLISPLDRETKDFYAFSVLAKDQGTPSLVGSIDVVIQVLDANDHAPVFTAASYDVRVQENVPRGTPILKVHASDGDSGQNGEIIYSISPSTSKLVRDIFDIDAETGQVSLKSELDREVKDVHKIWITAKDKSAGSPLDATVLATVTVDDLNDNPPLIDVSYFPPEASAAFISEDAPVGTFAALIRLKDADSGENARAVCLLQSDTFTLKQQSEDTYAIITSKLLDREKREEYLLELTAKDQGKPSLESRTTLQIVVGDVNDSPPVFDRSTYNVKVKENSPLGMEVVQLKVTDKDSAPENQGVLYQLSEPSGLFSLDEKRGILIIQSQLDRETQGDVVQFMVEAFDPENPSLPRSLVPVVIELVDENDNTPEWSAGSYEFDITTDLRPGVVVGTVLATDVDFGNNGVVSYSLNNSDFIINRTSGELVTAQEIFVSDARQIRLEVMATDNGEPRRSSSAQLFITIANATTNQLTHTRKNTSFVDFLFGSATGLPIIIALIVVSLLLLCGAVIFAVIYRNKSKENHSYNVRVETARVFQRGSKSQLAGGDGSDTDSCHRRSVESGEEKYASWVFPSQTPPVSSSTKSSRCSSANTNRNSLLNDYGKTVNGPIIYDIVNEEAATPPGKSIQTFQLANQLQKALDKPDGSAMSSEEDDDGGFKRHTVVRASSFYQTARHPLTYSTAHAQRCNSSAAPNHRTSSPAHCMTLPHRGSVKVTRGAAGCPVPESGYSSTVSNASCTIRTNPREDHAPLSRLTKNCIDQLQITTFPPMTPVPFTASGSILPSSKTPADFPESSPFSSSLNMSINSRNTSSLGAGLEFDEFLPANFSSPLSNNTLPRPVYHVVEYHTPC